MIMAKKKSNDQINTVSGSFSSKSFTLESFRYVPSAGEKLTANISGKQPSLNISGEVKEVEFRKSDIVPYQVGY